MLKSELEAEELEKQAKIELKNKNYHASKSLFEKARDIYLQLNYMGKVNVIEKQLAQIKRVIEYEQKTNKKSVAEIKGMTREVQEKEETIIKTDLYQKGPHEKKVIDNQKEFLSEAEIRRARIREQMVQREKEEQLERTQDHKIKVREDLNKKKSQRREEEIKATAEKEKRKETLMKEGEKILDRAKMAIDNKEFKEAKIYYGEAIKIFKDLGWFDQVDILYREIKHVEFYEEEYLKKKMVESQKRQQKEEQFQKRVDTLLEEKKQKEQLQSAKFKKISPDVKKTIDKVRLLLEKAEKEINTNMYQRALNRYQYILELYSSIPPEKLDLNDEKFEVKKKIDELKLKI
ncbi:MAG: hypothetical protein ACFFDK_17125 [Promethearchaeota archaeon]